MRSHASLYFGCWNVSGHYLWQPCGSRIYSYSDKCPFSPGQLDQAFAPPGVNESDRVVRRTHINGWTVIAMWDRSIDRRPGSNAAFLAPGNHSEAEMWRIAERDFRHIVDRLVAYQVRAGLPS